MLILTVKKGEPIYLSGGIKIIVNGHSPGRYTLALDIPDNVRAVRDSAINPQTELPTGHSSTMDILRAQRAKNLQDKNLKT